MIDNLIEFTVAGIILAVGAGVVLVLLGGSPEIATSLISGVTRVGVVVLIVGILVAIPLSVYQTLNP